MEKCHQYKVHFLKLKRTGSGTAGIDLVMALGAHVAEYGKGCLAIVIYNGHITGKENECLLAQVLRSALTTLQVSKTYPIQREFV